MNSAIFDLDGTLADTSGDLIAAANACFRQLGLESPLDSARDRPVAFQGGRAMLRLGFKRRAGHAESEAVVNREYRRLLKHYGNAIDRHTFLYPGVEDALQRLKRSGWQLGVCTNKPEGLARVLLERLGVMRLFRAVVGGDTLPVCKPDPAPYLEVLDRMGGSIEKSFLVGDTANDAETARAAGARLVLVSFGPEGDGLSRLRPDAMLDRYEDLPGLAERIVQ